MRFRKKKQEKNKEKYIYKPTKFFIISMIFIIALLIVSDASPILFAIIQIMLFLVFVFDVERQKQRRGEN